MNVQDNMSRKRPAPGTSPLGYQSQPQQPSNMYNNSAQPLTDDQFFDWGANAQNPTTYPPQPVYNVPNNAYPTQMPAPPSNQLARRPVTQVMARPPAQNNQWMNESSTTPVQQQDPAASWSDDIEELVAKAQVAKRDAQSRRKQIPPFVMKLHSFLENPKNTDLIRWADDGKSFVVLNEDEFANKLIPELFKHNNYASFVRQLNMYGFHKKVGLSDNSMRASERKAKSPSEYWNPFFRKGYPDLLWLIQKPKNQTTSQKNRNQPRSKSEDRDEDEDFPDETNPIDNSRPRPQLTLGQAPPPANTALTSEQFQTVQRELMMIRRQQNQITQMLGQLKREHDALVDQANDYQDKHSRHEQSINAILTFLATLYNRSLQNHEGAQDIAKVFAQTLAQDKNKNNLVDVDNLVFDFPEAATIDGSQKSFKRPRLMITDGSDTRANTLSPSTSATSPIARSSRRSSHMARSPQSAHVEEIFDPDVNQSNQRYQSNQGGQQQHDMMSLIHNTNARNSGNNTPVQDFSHVLNDIESSSGSAPVSAAQRENMVRVFNDQARRSQVPQNTNKATYSTPNRSKSQMQFDSKLANTSNDLDDLAQLQAAQDKSVENLTSLLQPLSPTGSIPGIGDGQDVPPPPLNIDDFINTPHDYFTDFSNEGNGNLDFGNYNNSAYNNNLNGGVNDYDFADDAPLFGDVDENQNADNNFLSVNNYDGTQDGRRVESVASSSEAPTPKNEGSDTGDWANINNNTKNRRTS